MRTSVTVMALSKNCGISDSVRNPCAMGAPNGPALARSTSTWIHWWSPVAWANRLMCSWVTVTHALVATCWPTRAESSARVAKVVMPSTVASRNAAACPPGDKPVRSLLRVQPLADRLPLRQIALYPPRRHVKHREAARGELDVVLCVAHKAQHRQAQAVDKGVQLVGCAGAFIHAHTHDTNLRLGGVSAIGQLVQKGAGGKDVEHTGLQWYHHLVGEFEYLFQALAMQAGRGVQHHVGGALGRFGNLVITHVPAADGPGRSRPQGEPEPRGLLPVGIPQHDGMPLGGKVARNLGSQGGLTHSAFGIGDNNHGHTRLLGGWNCAMLSAWTPNTKHRPPRQPNLCTWSPPTPTGANPVSTGACCRPPLPPKAQKSATCMRVIRTTASASRPSRPSCRTPN